VIKFQSPKIPKCKNSQIQKKKNSFWQHTKLFFLSNQIKSSDGLKLWVKLAMNFQNIPGSSDGINAYQNDGIILEKSNFYLQKETHGFNQYLSFYSTAELKSITVFTCLGGFLSYHFSKKKT